MTRIERLIIAAIILLVVASFFGAIDKEGRHEKFMADCLHDKKEYECETMWKTANPDPQLIYVVH